MDLQGLTKSAIADRLSSAERALVSTASTAARSSLVGRPGVEPRATHIIDRNLECLGGSVCGSNWFASACRRSTTKMRQLDDSFASAAWLRVDSPSSSPGLAGRANAGPLNRLPGPTHFLGETYRLPSVVTSATRKSKAGPLQSPQPRAATHTSPPRPRWPSWPHSAGVPGSSSALTLARCTLPWRLALLALACTVPWMPDETVPMAAATSSCSVCFLTGSSRAQPQRRQRVNSEQSRWNHLRGLRRRDDVAEQATGFAHRARWHSSRR